VNNNIKSKDVKRGKTYDIQTKDLKTMPVRQYLDNTVVPVILQALTEVAKERYIIILSRPANPIEFVAQYLLNHKDGKEGTLKRE